MRVLLHAGFHKSGTTSIQRALLETKSESYIYPFPALLGPGHAAIARAGHDPNSPEYDPKILLNFVEQFNKKFTIRQPRIVISSEGFTAKPNFEPIQQLTRAHQVDLVLTRRPVHEALPSWQQEMIKHGDTNHFLSEAGLREAEKHMQFNVDYIHDFINNCNFNKITIISTTSSKPNFIFEIFSKMLNTELEIQIENVRLSESTLQELVRLNINKLKQRNVEQTNSFTDFLSNAKPQMNLLEESFRNVWDEKEKNLIEYFTSQSRSGFIEFVTAI
jgi:hypothetical protein